MRRTIPFRLARTLVVLASWAAAAPLAAQDHANHTRGFRADQVYQSGGIDHVNLFNGNLTIAIPVGQAYPVGGRLSYGLTLAYSGNVWDVEERCDATGCYTQLLPNKDSNAGLGWVVSLGKLLGPWTGTNDTGSWVYHGPDGAEHGFFQTLHPTDPVTSGVFYSRDGTYLRLKSATRELELPDGAIHTFLADGRLSQMRDRFGNALNVTYPNATTWQLADPHGRTHFVYFKPAVYYSSYGPGVVDRVVLAAFNGTTATYTFGHTDADVTRACNDNDPQTGATERVPLLTSLTLPDGSAYSLPLADYDTLGGACPHHAGHLKGVTLPTLGKLEWDYQNYAFPSESGAKPPLQRSTGVARRRMKNAAGTLLGEWTYTAELLPNPSVMPSNPPRERVTTIVDPLGHRRAHYFSAYVSGVNTVGAGGWSYGDYGLPFSRELADGTSPARHLSSRTWNAAGTLLRTSYVRYERDSAGTAQDANRREVSSRTVFSDDGGRAADLDRSDFDGLGRYRVEQTGGGFPAGNVRTHYTQYSAGNGTYAVDASGNPTTSFTFQMVPATAPWVLGIEGFRWQSEDGVTAAVSQAVDPNTGWVSRRRIHRPSDGGQSSQDVLVELAHDGAGNLASERYYGGDTQPLAIGNLHALTLPQPPSYRIDHTYQSGALKTSQYVDGNGFWLPFKSADFDLDANTGRVRTSRETAGLATTYTYDALGRLTLESPPAGHLGKTRYTYTRATSSAALARVDVDQQNNAGTANLARSKVLFDAFGRVWQEQTLMPNGTWPTRETLYNGAGLKSSVSETGATGKRTTFGGYDPFGRPGTITPPDGAAHAVTLTYAGSRIVNRTVKVGTSRDVNGNILESSATTTEEYDRQGRLWKVTEPSGSSGANVTTTYAYDVGGRLKQVTQPNGASTQTRSFAYDSLGFLRSETHPEKGLSGNGTVSYLNYNARGHAERKIDGAHDLTFRYDRAERLVEVKETGGRSLKLFSYAGANATSNWKLGKLEQATRYNYVAIGATPYTIQVSETYAYGGLGGLVSRRDTQTWVNGGPSESFTQSFAYDALGNVGSLGYPECTHLGCTNQAAQFPRSVAPVYTNGFLTGLPGYTATVAGQATGIGITYHGNGMVSQIAHANGVTVTQANDPNSMRRPASIATSGADVNWSSGSYAYDGAGNVTKIGTSWFLYDKVSRLTTGTVFDGPTGGGVQKQQTYGFDPAGNITGIGGTVGRSTPTSAATNRLNSPGTTYDAAGNLTAWNGASYQYDAFGNLWRMLNGAEDWLYLYTADDERLWSFKAGSNFSRWTMRDLGGKVLREYLNNQGSWSVDGDYVYRDGLLLASYQPSGKRNHFHLDHLGTPRLVTNAAAQKIAYHVYYPFGEEATAFNQDAERMKLTGHERDLASLAGTGDDLDYMHARFYSPLTARFHSFDPIGGNPRAPQSWNRYAYVLGRPLVYTDPEGLFAAGPGLNSALRLGWASAYMFSDTITVTTQGDPILDYDPLTGVAGLNSLLFDSSFISNVSSLAGDVRREFTLYAGAYYSAWGRTAQTVAAFHDGANPGGDPFEMFGVYESEEEDIAHFTGEVVGTVASLATAGAGYKIGVEVRVGRNLRLAPFGNRTGDKIGRFPHYHRRGRVGPDGKPLPGKGMKRHRPWQPPAPGQPWRTRF